MKIRIGIRKNLFYLLMLTFFNFLRNIDIIVLEQTTGINSSLFLTFFMFLGEFIAGLCIYFYQITIFPKQKKVIFMGIKLIQAPNKLPHPDSNYKIYFLIFIASYFDFIEFMLATLYIPKYENISISLSKRLSGILTISAALLCYNLLELPMFRHHKFSLLIVSICFIIIIVSEYFFSIINGKVSPFYLSLVIFLIFINHFFTAFKDVIEKYLLEIDFIDPFKLLMLEGIFGCVMTSLYSFIEEPFTRIKIIFDENNYKSFIVIICFFLFFFFSGGRNAYRIITNKLYSPMTRTLTDCILDPLILIYFFIFEKDFSMNDNYNFIDFIINLIISIIIVFCGCVYNEFLVLFCCKLEHNTHYNVSIRASNIHNIFGDEKKFSQNKTENNETIIEESISSDNISEDK